MWRGGSHLRKDRCRNMIGPLVGFSLVDRPISLDKLLIKNCQVVQPEIASHAISSNFLMQFSIQHNAVNVLQAPTAARLCPHCSQVRRPGDGRDGSGRSDRGGASGEVLFSEFFLTDDTVKERESVTRSQSEATPGPLVDSSASKRAKSAVRLQQLTLSSGTIEVRSARSQISSELHLRK